MIFILIAQYLLIPTIHAQNRDLRFEHITVEDGLSQSWVHCIFQDSYGFIWIGTEDGLNLYDGQKMMIYKHNLRDKKSISSNTISAIFEDSSGSLWIGTTNGLNLYDRTNDCFDLIEEINTWSVLSIAEDKDQNLWIGTVYTLYRYNPVTKSLKRFEASARDQDNKISNNYINKILIDSDNNIWVATNDGLNLFNPANESFTKYFYDPLNPASISSNHINTLLEDSEKRIWCGNDNGLNWFKNAKVKPSEGIFARYSYLKKDPQSIASGEVLALIEDREKKMWIGIENGGIDILDLKSFNGEDALFIHHTHDPRYSYSLNNNSVQTIFQDKQDIIWVGTFGNGINKYSKADANFKHYFNEAKDEKSLSDNHVNVFLEDGQFVWIGTEGGLNRFNKADGTFKRYVNQPGNPSSLSSNAVWAIFKDSRGDLWVGTWAGGLNKFDYRTETFAHYINNPADSTSLGSNNVFSIYEDKALNLWIGTMGNGINKFNPKNGKFERYSIANTDINSDYVEAIIGNPDGTMWLANVTSLELFDPVTFSFEHFMHTSDTNSISGNKIFSVFRDSKNRVWVGTDAGLNLFDEKNKSFLQFFTEEGLPDNSIKSIIEDQRGDIWIGTNK